jgi:Sulfatase
LDSVRVVNDFNFLRAEVWVRGGSHIGLAVVLATGALVAVLRWRAVLARASMRLLLILAPFALVTTGRAASIAAFTDFAVLEPHAPPATFSADTTGQRVVILVFDELDYGLAFSRRPAYLRLESMDRLRREGFFATDVEPASRLATARALPSLLTGRVVDSVRKNGPSSALAWFHGQAASVDLATTETLFDDAGAEGAPSELIGTHLPYCRWRLASFARRCTWIPVASGVLANPQPLAGSIMRQLRALGGPVGSRDTWIRSLREITAVAVTASVNPANRLVFVHLAVPHAPFVWNASTGSFTRFQFRQSGYFGNLGLADHILGQFLTTIEGSPLRDRTTIVVTSDHGFRGAEVAGVAPDRHVPFAVLFPSRTPTRWEEPLYTVPLRPLSIALLRGELRSGDDLRQWLQHRTRSE